MIRRNRYTILIFSSVCLVIAIVVFATDNSCNAINKYSVSNDALEIPFISLKFILEFLLASGLFMMLRKMAKAKFRSNYHLFKYIYFAVLPLVIFHSQLFQIPDNIANRDVVRSICSKSDATAMTSKSNDLNLNEYNYLKKQCFWLPDIPKTSENIYIDYYSDDFLGEFILHIKLLVDNNEPINKKDQHWFVKDVHIQGKKIIEYENHN